MATMFPETAGGVAAYAREGFRRHTVLVRSIVNWGYWLGYSLVLFIKITVRDRRRNAAVGPKHHVAGEAHIISSSLIGHLAVDFEGGTGHYLVQ